MKKSFKIMSALILSSTMAFGLGATIFAGTNKNVQKTEALYSPSTHYEVSDTASELASYYSSISSSDSGTSLLGKLQTLNNNKRKTTVGYGTMGTTASNSAYIYTDYVLGSTTKDSNGQVYGSTIASFYTKTSATSWNREHMWPNSRGGSAVEGDILHTRPTISSENSSRGNSFYVEGMNNSSNGWDPYTAGYEEWVRGECARTILYCVVANSNFSLSDASAISSGQTGYTSTMGDMDTLIKWHFKYTPNQYEMNRNNGAEYLQGNRNPFVDHPEYVAKIWSNFNSNISSLCTSNASVYSNWTVGSCSTYGTNDAAGGTSTDPAISIYAPSTSVKVGNSITLQANKSNITGTVQWYVSDSSTNVVSLSATSGDSITVTGVSEGTKTIYAHIGTVSAHVDITVTSASSSQGGLVTSNSDLSTGDKVVVRTQQDTPNGVTGWNNSKDATISTTESSWKQFTVKDASSTGFKLYDDAAQQYIASPGGNEFKYSTSGGVCSVDSDGHLICNSRYLTINGTNYRFYSSIGSYTPFYVYSVGSSSTKTLSSIAVKTAPTKTTYTAGEHFDPAGLVIRATYSDNSIDDITYSTSNSSSFTFNPTTSTALTTSHTSVTISYGGKSCSQSITVNAATTPTVNSVSVSPSTLSLSLSGTTTGTLTATVSVSGGAAQTVTWSTSNSSVATVSSSGVVTAKGVGTCTITATSTADNTKSASCTVSVSSGSTSSGTEYQKVASNSDLTSGQYLIVYEDGNLAFDGSLSTLDAVSNSISVTISNNKITKTNATTASEFTIDTSAGSIKSASGYYIGATSNSNVLSTSSSAITNTIALDGTNVDIASSSAHLRYNSQSGQTRFRYFKSSSYSSQKAIQLYKLNSSSTTTKTLSSIAVSNATTTYTVGDTFVKPTVTATYSDATTADVTNSATFSDYDMTTAGNYTVNVSYTDGSVTKTTSYSITVNAGSSTTKTYQVVTSASDLAAGDKVVVVGSNNDSYYYMTAAAKSETLPWYLVGNDVTPSNNQIAGNDLTEWTVGKSGNYFTFTNNSNDLYGYVNGTHYSLNLGSSYTMNNSTTNVVSSYSGVNTWTYTITDSSTGAATLYANSSANVYLEYYNSSFCGYKNVPTSGAIFLFKEVTTGTNPALEYAQNFLAAFTCDATGTNAPTFASGKSWASLKTAFQALATPHQNTLKNATANESGTDIEKAVARYDYVVAKYGYENFMNRTISNQANKMNPFNSSSTNNLFMVLGSISLLGGLTYLAYFLKKRKED